jgi:addiction module HigA family antidote
MVNKIRPVHPGEVLKGELEELNLSANAFAKELSVPVNRITSIINGKRSITADTALRLSLFFGTTPEFWLNLQTSYDLKILIKQDGKKIQKEVHSYREVA